MELSLPTAADIIASGLPQGVVTEWSELMAAIILAKRGFQITIPFDKRANPDVDFYADNFPIQVKTQTGGPRMNYNPEHILRHGKKKTYSEYLAKGITLIIIKRNRVILLGFLEERLKQPLNTSVS